MKSVKAHLFFLWMFSWQSETEDAIKCAFRTKMEVSLYLATTERNAIYTHTEKRKEEATNDNLKPDKYS